MHWPAVTPSIDARTVNLHIREKSIYFMRLSKYLTPLERYDLVHLLCT